MGPTIDLAENPLQWWKDHRNEFPSLASTAQHFLGIPATSVASERLFSKAGQIVTSRRENLSSQLVEKLVFLHENV